MLIICFIFFALTALGGLFLLSYFLTNKNTPKGVAIIHGGFGTISILLLIIYSCLYRAPWVSLSLFILAALGGILVFTLDLTGKKIAKPFAFVHGAVAVSAFLTLILYWLEIL